MNEKIIKGLRYLEREISSECPAPGSKEVDWLNCVRSIIAEATEIQPTYYVANIDGKYSEAVKELVEALGDLSFACFGGLGVTAPSVEVYNRTFAVYDKHRTLAKHGTQAATPESQRDDCPTWVIVQRPGMVPDRKGPFHNTEFVEDMLRELYELYSDCICTVVDMPVTSYPESGREWLSINGDKRRKEPPPYRATPSPSNLTAYGEKVREAAAKAVETWGVALTVTDEDCKRIYEKQACWREYYADAIRSMPLPAQSEGEEQ